MKNEMPMRSIKTQERNLKVSLCGSASEMRIDAISGLFGLGRPYDEDVIEKKLAEAAQRGDMLAGKILDCKIPLVTGTRLDEVKIEEKPYVSIFPSFFSPLECFYIIEYSRSYLEQSAVISSDGEGRLDDSVRDSMTAWLPSRRQDILIRHLRSRVLNAMCSDLKFAEPLNVVRYRVGGKFMAHLDAFKYNPPCHEVEQGSLLRIATAIIYLNSSYYGGETTFVELRKKITTKDGDLLYFRNVDSEGNIDTRTLHGSLPIESGEKWIMVQWVTNG